jgi:hypothetical protein
LAGWLGWSRLVVGRWVITCGEGCTCGEMYALLYCKDKERGGEVKVKGFSPLSVVLEFGGQLIGVLLGSYRLMG